MNHENVTNAFFLGALWLRLRVRAQPGEPTSKSLTILNTFSSQEMRVRSPVFGESPTS